RAVEGEHRLVKVWTGERQPHAGHPRERGDELAGARVRGGRGAGEALWTHQRHVDGGGGHSQALVGADVGSRPGAADVLLARLQRGRARWGRAPTPAGRQKMFGCGTTSAVMSCPWWRARDALGVMPSALQ